MYIIGKFEWNWQFEWAWQHPVKSLAVRKATASFKSLSGIANKIKLAYTMLTLPSWQRSDFFFLDMLFAEAAQIFRVCLGLGK